MTALGSGCRARMRGMVLVTALLLLVVVTILAVGMFRGFGLDEKIAGNMREKHRALNAAESAEQYAEWWLSQGNGTSGIVCAPPLAPANAPVVCSNQLNPVAPYDVTNVPLPWSTGVSYVPATPTALTVGTGPNEYFAAPAFYITYLGPGPGGAGIIYQIDAAGFGGSADTAAVVETNYLVQQSNTCSTCSQ